MDILILTDSCCDLPYDYILENKLHVIPLTITINGEQMEDKLAETKEYKSFYDAILAGAMPQTAQANVFDFKEIFLEAIKQNKAIIYIGFSSALSGCINSAQIAREEVKEDYPLAQIAVVDSKCASMGQGLLIHYAVEMVKKGKNMEEVATWLEDNKLNLNHWFTVADLNHLFRGGRVSRTAATFGTLLQIKPILHVDHEGRLIPIEKVKGRKKSLKVLAEKVKDNIIDPAHQVVFISHGDCLEEAEEVKTMLLETCGVKEVKINYMGAAVGSHAGPGTVAIFFMGKER